LTEDIFLKAFLSIKKYEKKDKIPFTAWLYRIASNTVIDYYRTNKVNFSYDLDFEKADE
jgi:RNA polymerase sigma-70 factor (ECF subfamily)